MKRHKNQAYLNLRSLIIFYSQEKKKSQWNHIYRSHMVSNTRIGNVELWKEWNSS